MTSAGHFPLATHRDASITAAYVSTDTREQWQLNLSPSYSWNAEGGWGQNANLSLTVRLSTRITTTIGQALGASRSKFQYVRDVADTTSAAFSGRRHVLADLSQRQLTFDTRVNRDLLAHDDPGDVRQTVHRKRALL